MRLSSLGQHSNYTNVEILLGKEHPLVSITGASLPNIVTTQTYYTQHLNKW